MRCYIRFCVQREFGWDDAFLLLGLCCLVSSITLMFAVINCAYELEDQVFGWDGVIPDTFTDTSTIVQQTVCSRKMLAAAVVLMWLTICAVKMCFLAFFKRLIRQLPTMVRYWWLTLAFNVVTTGYGVTVLIVACPYFEDDQIIELSKFDFAHLGIWICC